MVDRYKLGLSLSGGGLRAAFFHLGTLARLAELGLLRRVEVISTVSGGSIIGALYYLHLKNLLESKPDENITDHDYINLIQTIERDFLSATQKNLRILTFSDWKKNLKMATSNYTRSDRMGELLDQLIYAPASGHTPPIPMHCLKIYPQGSRPGFHPRADNRYRQAKVPILLLNSASLNTGRNWRFEASRMGESDKLYKQTSKISIIPHWQLPASYEQLPAPLKDFGLGKAVAASAAVPGIFKPLPLTGMYPDRTVQLVDGGLHDNQGVQGLLDESCNFFVISDASSQMEEDKKPSSMVTSVLSRSGSILNSRVREEQLVNMIKNSQNHTVALIHMTKGIIPPIVPLIGQENGKEEMSTVSPIDLQVQLALSRVRTDLDAFTEIEAYSLMCAGYKLSSKELTGMPSTRSPIKALWRFSQIEPYLTGPTTQYLHHLKVASSTFGKVFKLLPGMGWLGIPTIVILLYALIRQQWWKALFQNQAISWSWGHIILSALALVILFGFPSNRFLTWLVVLFKPGAFIYRLIYEGIIPLIGSVFSRLYLLVLNPLFLWLGEVERLKPTSRHKSEKINLVE
jgi:predicted acylesterase/phospholipase RssA